MVVVTARAAALRILAARQSAGAPVETSYTLADYQAEAVGLARAIMRRRGGVILADDVGLGKTYMAAALIEDELRSGGQPLVVVPAALRSTWRAVLKSVLDPARVSMLSHTQLSRGAKAAPASLVVVDEAHAFRNPKTRRYRQLRRICRSSRVLLLTATPINNSLLDLYFQLRLWAADDACKDIGIGSLRALLQTPEIDRLALARLRQEVMVRRTRDDLAGGDWPGHVELHTVRTPAQPCLNIVAELIDGLALECYDQEVARVLVKLSLLKRLQSSRAAGLRSIDRLIALHQDCLAAIRRGRLLRPRLRPPGNDDGQLSMLEVLLPELPAHFRQTDYKRLLDRDLQSLQQARQTLAAATDAKLSQLRELLSARPPPARTIVFTEFSDTAMALWQELRSLPRAVITSGSAYLGEQSAAREEVVRLFAPQANGGPEPRAAEAVYVLIATDVLAEGLNLQDASAVISYDLPWNPVRLIQRAGRIDRRGSPHARIDVFNVLPGHELDGFLRIVRRLQSKLFALRSALRPQKAVLEPAESLADKPGDPLSGMLSPQTCRIWEVDLAAAGPVGSLATASPEPRRVLLSMSRNCTVRELIFDDDRIASATPAAADAILEAALQSDFLGHADHLTTAVAAARDFLDAESLAGSVDPSIEALRRAIRQAVGRLGLLAPPWLIELADRTLASSPGYLGPGARHMAQLRAGTTTNEIARVLEAILVECNSGSPREAEAWQLIAAVAAD